MEYRVHVLKFLHADILVDRSTMNGDLVLLTEPQTVFLKPFWNMKISELGHEDCGSQAKNYGAFSCMTTKG